MFPVPPQFPLRVFYDGACVVCAAEVEHYGRKDQHDRLQLIDISAPDFDPQAFGLSHEDFMRQMHVIDQSDRIYRGVDAFWAIWQAFPHSRLYRLFTRLISWPALNSLARIGYRCFARYRHLLPKRAVCNDNSCRLPK